MENCFVELQFALNEVGIQFNDFSRELAKMIELDILYGTDRRKRTNVPFMSQTKTKKWWSELAIMQEFELFEEEGK